MNNDLSASERVNLSSRDRLIQAALTLFASQGITATTTRQIAEQAEVNEVTLFRQFGNKEGLLLAVINESPSLAVPVLANLPLHNDLGAPATWSQGIEGYASATLTLLEQVPDLLRSLVGEAHQYSDASRQALGRRLTEANQALADYLQPLLPPQTAISATALASLLNELLLGYVLVQTTSEFNQLWPNRQDFLANLTALFSVGDGASYLPTPVTPAPPTPNHPIQDLPASLVQKILQQASKSHLQDVALAYVLFGAGLTVGEVLGLQRHQQMSSAQQHTLVVQDLVHGKMSQRQVPLNQWIAGRRYGSYTNNPLSKWLRSRKDTTTAMFVNEAGQPLRLDELEQRWQLWTAGLTNPLDINQPLHLQQARQTWCVEMLIRGISVENLSLFTGLTPVQLQPYVQRAKEKTALEQATQLDRKGGV